MASEKYLEKLRDPRWQKKRLEILEYANWRCQICGNSKETLHVHHSYYEGRKDPWNYPNGSLICICESCHKTFHKNPKYPVGATQQDEIDPPDAWFLAPFPQDTSIDHKLPPEEIAKMFKELREKLSNQ